MIQVSILIINIAAAVMVITLKEFIKSAVSTALGDPLPGRDRRLTLNPLRHIDLLGLIIFVYMGTRAVLAPIFLFFPAFGWGKTVETSGLYYKNRKGGTLVTHIVPSLALIIMVLVLRLIFGSFMAFEVYEIGEFYLMYFLNRFAVYGLSLAFFNMIPIYPMDGGKVLSVFLSPNRVVRMAAVEKLIFMVFLLIMIIWPSNPLMVIIHQLILNILG